ncbi:hypothetical protein BGX29_010936 [Mortierella sp. GBA35]|nr:hypothetical protein BGX29_010936 [Mortierella sp. GBA35]
MAMRAETATASMVSPPVSPQSNSNHNNTNNNNNDITTRQQQPTFSLTKSTIPHDAQHNTTNADSTEADMMASLDAVLLSRKQEVSSATSDYYSSGHGEEDLDHHNPLPLPQHKVLASATTTTTTTTTTMTTQDHSERSASPLNSQTPELLLSPAPQQQQHTHLEVGHHDYNRAECEASTPTLEQMGLEKLDELELRMLLQNAYEVIQEKERDLGLAAMMGQDLIESNTHLEAKYQKVLTQYRQHRAGHRTRQLTPPRTIILSPPPEIPISSGGGGGGGLVGVGDLGGVEDDNNDENWVDDYEPSQHRSLPHSSLSSSLLSSSTAGSAAGGGSHHHNVSFRRSVSHTGGFNMRSRSRQDIEKLASLEDLNTELQMKVETITKELKQGRRQAFKRHRKAEQELKNVKNELERTVTKVVDLEEQNGRLIEASRMIRMRRIQLKNQLPAPGSIPGSTMATMAVEMQGDEMTIQEMLAEDNRIFEELRDRLKSLERMNLSLAHQKAEAEKKTQQIAQDLSDMQKDHEDLLTNLCGFSDLQTAYDKQAAHVQELENSIQELQNTVSTLNSRFSQMNSPLMSPSEPSSPMQSLWRRDDADFKALKTILHGSSPPQPMVLKSPNLRGQPTGATRRPRRTLLAELESEWFRDISFFGPPRVVADQQEQQQQIHLPGIHAPKSPKALKNHRHDSESEFFSDDTGGRVKGWRQRIRNINMEEESACESSNCIRKKHRRGRFQPVSTDDTDAGGMTTESHGGEDSDVERYQLYSRRQAGHHQLRKRRHHNGSGSDDDEDLSDCSDPLHHRHHAGSHGDNNGRPSSPDECCCHLYDDYSDYSSYDDEDEEESVVGWAHFEDYDASSFGYDKRRDGYYMGRRSRRGIFGMIQSVFLLFRLVWRWCRFISILSTALAIAIYRGPDALLTDGH